MDEKHVTVEGSTLEVRFPYRPETVALIKALPDAQWDGKERCWRFPATQFHAKQMLTLLPHGFRLDPRVQAMADQTEKVWVKQRPGLYPYQNYAVDLMLRRGGRVLLADEMGLGKTVEALAFLREIASRTSPCRILVVAPTSTLWKWADEVRRWTQLSPQVLTTSRRASLLGEVVILSPALMTRLLPELLAWKPVAVVADESHQYGNPKSQRTQALRHLSKKASYFLPMSGTPFLNRPIELFPILNMLDPVAYNNWHKYVTRYCDAHQTPWGWDVSGASHTAELSARLESLMIRRTKGEVLKDLPALTRTIIPLEVEDTSAIISAQVSLAEEARVKGTRASHHLEGLARLRHAIGMAKVAPTVEYVGEYIRQTGRKAVVAAHHKDVVRSIMDGLAAQNISVSSIVGDIPTDERHQRVKDFQTLAYPQVMVISQAGGEGINLFGEHTPVDLIVFAERDWNPAKEGQKEARLHRIGQNWPVSAVYLIVLHTVDERIAALVESKRALVNEVYGIDRIETEITDEVISWLLET